MAVIGELATLVTAKTEPFTKNIKKAGLEAKTFSRDIKTGLGGTLTSISGMLRSTTGLLAGFGGAMALGGLVRRSVQLAAAAEDMQTSYATYLKDLTKAKGLIQQLDKYSGATPFSSIEIKEAGKQLLAFGFTASQIMGTVSVLGDLAAGSRKPIAEFVDILGKVKAGGVASMGDVNRLADRGVPIFRELSKVMGVASSDVRTLVGTGKVGFTEMWEALQNVTAEGGLFAGAVQNLSETTTGKLSTLKDNLDKIFTEVGTSILQGLDVTKLTEQLTQLAQTYKRDIVDITNGGVALFQKLLKWGAQDVRALSLGGTMADIGYHGAMKNWRGMQMWLADKLGSQVTPEARQSYLYHNEEYGAAWRRGIDQATAMESAAVADIVRQQNARTRAGGGQADDRMQRQQTQTLDDIYRAQERQNELTLRQYELMRQQNYGYVGTF